MDNKQIFTSHAKAWDYVEHHEQARESAFVGRARALAKEAQLPVCSSAVGELLRTMPTLTHATSVIIIGTGALIEAAQIIEGLHGEGKLTAVESSAIGSTQMRALFSSIEEETHTTLRMVNTQPDLYLGRLNGDDYDLIVVSGDASNYNPAFDHAPRLLKKGGTILFLDALAMAHPQSKGGLINAADRSEKAVIMRELLNRVEDDEQFDSALIPAGTGIILAGYR